MLRRKAASNGGRANKMLRKVHFYQVKGATTAQQSHDMFSEYVIMGYLSFAAEPERNRLGRRRRLDTSSVPRQLDTSILTENEPSVLPQR